MNKIRIQLKIVLQFYLQGKNIWTISQGHCTLMIFQVLFYLYNLGARPKKHVYLKNTYRDKH